MQTAHEIHPVSEPPTRPVVLCVDDEASILASLKRALRKQSFELLIANSGEEALAVFEERTVDLVISDMRMPTMTGAELLARIYKQWPDTMRILLTGYADMESTVSAINDGQIFRYLNKPWNNDDLTVAIHSALEHKRLRDEHAALTALTQQQNAELQSFNTELEAKVAARTEELASAHADLRDSYQRAIGVFAQLIELREGTSYNHSQVVADLSLQLGQALSMDDTALADLQNAAVLHDVGKIGFTDALTSTPWVKMTPDQKRTYQTHPGIGQAALLSIPALENTGRIIRAHHEQINGGGFPDGLAGDAIPLAARIISVAADFDDLQTGMLLERPLSTSEALDHIKRGAGSVYDVAVVEALEALVSCDADDNASPIQEYTVHLNDLQPGMRTARNINALNGMLLLGAGQELTESLIERINRCLDDTGGSKLISVIKQ
ncbi:MAG: HD domain-containing phosphohydrolase [Pseudomonadota bacterium]